MIHNIRAVVNSAIKQLYQTEADFDLDRPDGGFGDFATNAAMRLAKPLGRNPRQIAEEIANILERDELIRSAEVAGPGFINIRVADRELVRAVRNIRPNPAYQGQIVVIETNNPNPFKDLHIGHAYNCIVADTIANLLEAGGAEVHRVSYHGDVGLHVGKSMWAILKWCGGDVAKLEGVKPEARPQFMSERYIEGATAYDQNMEAREEIERLARESFSSEDPTYKSVYETCMQWSFDYITETVKRLGSQPVERRYLESEADRVGVATVKAHVGDVFTESDGAIVFTGEPFGLHTRVFIASRGTGLYDARDLGLMQLKQRDFNPAKSYIVTGNEQREYFKVVIKAAELALPELTGVTENISTGIVKLSTGKMSSRTGKVLNIEWLFDQLTAALRERSDSPDVAETLIGALRYTMLRVRIGGDVVFDVESSISLEGNSGPYLQYAHARARSIIKKAGEAAGSEVIDAVLDEDERTLALKISAYDEAVALSINELLPHHLCNYLYELAQSFNRFYEKARIIGDERQAVRLMLVEAYADRLKRGLELLGIPAPESL